MDPTDASILLVGFAGLPVQHASMILLRRDGTPDPDFGSGGLKLYEPPPGDDRSMVFRAIEVSDTRIYVLAQLYQQSDDVTDAIVAFDRETLRGHSTHQRPPRLP